MKTNINLFIILITVSLICSMTVNCFSMLPKSIRQHAQTKIISESSDEALIKGTERTRIEAIEIASFRAKNVLGPAIEMQNAECSQEIRAGKNSMKTYWVCIAKFVKMKREL